jgi:hypothetical protein
MADSERRPQIIRLSPTTVAIGTHKASVYFPDESLLTDVGWATSTVITAGYFSLTVAGLTPLGASTTLFTFGTTANVTAGSFVTSTVYSITSLTGTSQAQWNTAAGTSGLPYVVGSVFTAAAAGAGTGTASAITRPVASDLYGYSGYGVNLPNAISVTGKATAAGTANVADVAVNVNLESRYYAADAANPTAVAYGALPANAPYGGNVISTIKPEFDQLGYGYRNRDGIRLPAGTTLLFTATLSTATADNVSIFFATRPGRD